MTDFNKECINVLLNKENFNEFMRTQLEEGFNQLLESELIAFLGTILMLERAGTLETLEMVATLDKLKLNSDRSKFKFLGTEKMNFTNILFQHMANTLTH